MSGSSWQSVRDTTWKTTDSIRAHVLALHARPTQAAPSDNHANLMGKRHSDQHGGLFGNCNITYNKMSHVLQLDTSWFLTVFQEFPEVASRVWTPLICVKELRPHFWTSCRSELWKHRMASDMDDELRVYLSLTLVSLQRRCFPECSPDARWLQMVSGRRPSPPLSLGVLAVSGCELLVDAGAD